ncbi:MAG: redoxin domain-containing protein [Patescibacteria group bacterium]
MILKVWQGRIWGTLLVVGLLIAVIPSPNAYATLESCTVSISPGTAEAGSDVSFNFSITNNSTDSIRWVDIRANNPASFNVQSGSATGWTTYADNVGVTFSDGNLPSPYDQGFVTGVTVGSVTGTNTWTIQASDDPSGVNAVTCSGDNSTEVSEAPVVISDVQLSGLTQTGVTVSWQTSAPATTQVNYGQTSSYGSQTDLDGTLKTSHQATINGLTLNTGYHLQVVSTDYSNHRAESGDITFLTAAKGTSSQIEKTTTVFIGSSGVPLLAKPIEKIPPTISLTTTLPRVVKAIPKVSGIADDNEALARIEYSTDDGKNWLPVDESKGLGGKHATFSFTPASLEEGDYSLQVRAIDTSANIGMTTPITIVIDRLPPMVGGNILSLGPQILEPDAKGTIASIVGIDQKITLSAVGGPNEISLNAVHIGSKSNGQLFNLTKSPETGLWSGIISFTQAGKYNMVANSVDGAGNKTSRTLNNVYVFSPGHTIDQTTHHPIRSTVTLYYLEPDSHSWVIWDGASYGQSNPQTTNKKGEFTMLLPPGKYYLKATAAGHETLISSIFETEHSKPLSVDLALKSLGGLSLGSLHLPVPSFAVQNVSLGSEHELNKQQTSGQGTLVGKQTPDFALINTDGKVVHAADLLGRPSVLTFGATWSPTMAEQLSGLAKLQANKELNVMPVALQESASKVRAYTDIAGLDLTWLVDPDSTLTTSYGVQSLPTHYFLDRHGVIKQVIVGVLTEHQLLNIMSGL